MESWWMRMSKINKRQEKGKKSLILAKHIFNSSDLWGIFFKCVFNTKVNYCGIHCVCINTCCCILLLQSVLDLALSKSYSGSLNLINKWHKFHKQKSEEESEVYWEIIQPCLFHPCAVTRRVLHSPERVTAVWLEVIWPSHFRSRAESRLHSEPWQELRNAFLFLWPKHRLTVPRYN